MTEQGSLNFTNEIWVLLVEHDRDSLIHTTRLLEACSYKVVAVQHESAALWALSERKQEFDFVLADIQLPDLDPFTLLHLTTNMGVRTILMCPDKDDMVLRRGLENGAYMVLEKPFSVETMKYLWQHVLREKISSNKATTDGDETSDESGESEESKGKISPLNDTQKKARRNGRENEGFRQSDSNSRVRKRICTEWTEELHQKFVDAVLQLGEGRCYPKDILEKMNVPGLTRMQVASHLQKCRNRMWRPSSKPKSPNAEISYSNSPRKFGSMPVEANPENSEQNDNVPPLGPPPGFGEQGPTNPQPDLVPPPSFSNSVQWPSIRPPPYLVPPSPGVNCGPFNNNSSASKGPYGNLSNVLNGEAMSNVVNQNERPNLNVQQGYVPTLSDLSLGTTRTDFHAGSSSQTQQKDNFIDFLPENIKFLYDRPEGSVSNQSSRTQQRSLDFDKVFSEQLSMASSGQTRGK